MTGFLVTFAVNIAFAIALAYALSVMTDRIDARWQRIHQAIAGILFGLLAVLCMEAPFEIRPGVLADLRNLMVFFAGPFGGPLAAGIAGAVAGAYRLYLGGLGALPGTGAILTAAALGAMIGWKYGRLKGWSAALGGVALFVATVPWFLAVGDLAAGWAVVQQVALPYLLFYVGGSVLLSGILMTDLRRREAERRLRLNEQRFRDLAELASDWFWEMDADLRMTDVGSRLSEITGFDHTHFIGKRRGELLGGPCHPPLEEHEAALARHEPFRDFRYAMRTVDGDYRMISVSGKPLFDAQGRFLGYRGSARDVTEEERQRHELDAARRAAVSASKAKSEFLAGMSHELRTPLNAVIGFSDLMKQEYFGPHSTPAYREYAADIHDSACHLLSLVNDVLDMAKIEAGYWQLERAPHAPGAIVAGALRLLRERAASAGVALSVEIAPDGPTLMLDERALKQVVLNLVANAIKFTGEGGTVRVAAGFDAEGRYVIEVADSGVGIRPEDLERVFEPFYQSRRGKLTSQGGTGLGLPLAKALVEAHGGTLELESRVGAGTRVRVALPADAPAAAADAADRPPASLTG